MPLPLPEPGSPVSPPGPDGWAASSAPGAEHPSPVQLRLQILTTEHWSLLASRSLAWNESFARAGTYLSTLSGAMVALGLIAGVDRLGDVFVTFAIVILPVVLFAGLATFLRMSAVNYHDAMTVYGMNRIRGAYVELAPDLEPYFVMGIHDDPAGIGITMATPPGWPGTLHLIAATPFLVSVLNGVVAGAITAIVVLRLLGLASIVGLVAAVVVFLAAMGAQGQYARGNIRRLQGMLRPMFPTPAERPSDADPATPGAAPETPARRS